MRAANCGPTGGTVAGDCRFGPCLRGRSSSSTACTTRLLLDSWFHVGTWLGSGPMGETEKLIKELVCIRWLPLSIQVLDYIFIFINLLRKFFNYKIMHTNAVTPQTNNVSHSRILNKQGRAEVFLLKLSLPWWLLIYSCTTYLPMSLSVVCVRARRPELSSKLRLLEWCSDVSMERLARMKREDGRQPSDTTSYIHTQYHTLNYHHRDTNSIRGSIDISKLSTHQVKV